jgi:hypothetical protein
MGNGASSEADAVLSLDEVPPVMAKLVGIQTLPELKELLDDGTVKKVLVSGRSWLLCLILATLRSCSPH